MPDNPTIKGLYELQTGGYPLEQVLLIEREEDGRKIPTVCAFFADLEMDVFFVEFGYDDDIILHAEDLAHITTTPYQLEQIASLSDQGFALVEELMSLSEDGVLKPSVYAHLLTQPQKN